MRRSGVGLILFLSQSFAFALQGFKMALAGLVVKTKFLIFPIVVFNRRFEFARNISKMAASCKSGRNKRREVKVG